MTVEFLDPGRKLVDEVADWLCGTGTHAYKGRVRVSPEGARTLDHVMVVVPTAQSGRNLRLAIARRFPGRGVVPPRVVPPMRLVTCAETTRRIASDVELRAAFLKFVAAASSAGTLSDYPHLFLTRRADGTPYDLAKDFRAQLAFFDQLQDIWRILAGGGLTMADVPTHPKAAAVFQRTLGDEAARWEELARFERDFFGRLHDGGLRHQAEDIRLARTNPVPVAPEVEEVVLPLLADPVAALYDVLAHQRADLRVTVLEHCDPTEADRFDAWGRPVLSAWTAPETPVAVGLRDADIVCTARDEDLAKRVAEDFPPADAEVRRPSLGLCDGELFPELAAAFLNRGYVLHNPERHRLTVSSLGRMLSNLLDLYVARKDRLPWAPFVALLREDDVLTAFADGAGGPDRAAVLAGIDVCQNTFLPTVLAKGLAYDAAEVHRRARPALEVFVTVGKALLAVLESAWSEDAAPAAFLRQAMSAIFARRALRGTDEEREFRAATDAVRTVLDAFDGEGGTVSGLAESTVVGLLRKALSEAAYSLEPTERNAVSTEGWLELVWSGADRIALAGFTEGAVPDSVVGHPFVPDELRIALGLMSNAGRLARDTMLLADLVRSRAETPGAVRAYLAMTNAAGDQRRPSRLLFLVRPDALAARVRRLFGEPPAGGLREARRLEPKWRPDLPLDGVPLPNVSERDPRGRLSASAIDVWLRCPFTYLLKYGLGMERFKEKVELAPNDFGLLIHGVLEDYANEQLARSARGLDQLTDERDVAAALSRLLAVRRAGFGDRLALRLRLQFDAAEGRLLAFAPLQAKWASEGWRIAEPPEYKFNVRPFAGEDDVDLPFNGSIDRIDCRNGKYRLIDYKTWDERSAAKAHVVAGGERQHGHAVRLRLPELVGTVKTTGAPKYGRFLSVQLLLYAKCLECADAKFAGTVDDCCYVVLGKDAKNVFVFGSCEDQGPFDAYKRANDRVPLIEHRNLALDTVRTAIRRIRGNFFWPPGPTEEWKYDFKELFVVSPERDFPEGTAWRDVQEAKLDGLEGAR